MHNECRLLHASSELRTLVGHLAEGTIHSYLKRPLGALKERTGIQEGKEGEQENEEQGQGEKEAAKEEGET